MHSCEAIDPLVTPYVDGELPPSDRETVSSHLRLCAPCHSRVAAERAVRNLIRERKPVLARESAPVALRRSCAALARRASQAGLPAASTGAATARPDEAAWYSRLG